MIDREELIKKHINEKPPLIKGLESLDIKGLANYIKNGYCQKILILTGAGISVKSGIPDFRSPGTGIYDNIKNFNISNPELLFNRSFINKDPKPFFTLIKKFLSKEYEPSNAHYLSVLFKNKGVLMRYYTQNIDGLDLKAGLTSPYLIECHGQMRTSTCSNIFCKNKISTDLIKNKILNDEIPKCEKCNSIIIPDIVMNDDDLPEEFFDQLDKDFHECDLLIVMGTSLKVEPFPGMIEDPSLNMPRVLINNEKVVTYFEELREKSGKLVETSKDRLSQKFKFGHFFNRRDIFLGGDLDNNVLELIKELGWEKELNDLKNKNLK